MKFSKIIVTLFILIVLSLSVTACNQESQPQNVYKNTTDKASNLSESESERVGNMDELASEAQ